MGLTLLVYRFLIFIHDTWAYQIVGFCFGEKKNETGGACNRTLKDVTELGVREICSTVGNGKAFLEVWPQGCYVNEALLSQRSHNSFTKVLSTLVNSEMW